MAADWIVIVNRIEARIYSGKDMRKLYTLKNPLGREKNRAFTTSRPCLDRNRSLAKSSTHNLGDEKSPHDDAAKAFAHKINNYLYKRFIEHRFESLAVFCEPRMQGWLKDGMDKRLKERVLWRAKDLGKLNDHELKKLVLAREASWMREAPYPSGF